MDSYETTEPQQAYDGQRDYPDRERSRSPRPDYRDNGDDRVRDEDMRDRSAPVAAPAEDDQEAANAGGTNLFVTGIHPRLTEDDITRLFEKYGNVEKANIMRDPHSRESRGFGFVNMATAQEADAAKEGLQGEVYEGRTLSIEKAKRAKPRIPTPGKYFGPPKRDDRRGGGGRYGDRYDDRRGGGGYGGGRRDDPYYRGGGGGGRDRYDDRGYGGGRDRYEDRGYGGGGGGRRDRPDEPARDRYGSDRYGSRGGDGGRRYDDYGRGGSSRPVEGAAPGGYGGEAAGAPGASGSRGYEDDRYTRR